MHTFTITKHSVNGVPIIQLIDPSQKTSTVALWFRGGYRSDVEYPPGMAHFFEHLLMQQTKTHVNPIDRYLQLESMGIEGNAYTDFETAVYYQSQRVQHTRASLEILLRDWRETVFSCEGLEREREVIQNELAERQDDLSLLIADELTDSLFPGYPVAFPPLGTSSSLTQIALEDVKRFYASFYTPDKLVVTLLAPEPIAVNDILERFVPDSVVFSPMSARQAVISEPIYERTVQYDGGRCAVGVAFRTVCVEQELADRVALNVLKNCFGNCWSSILLQRLRHDRSLAYWVDAQTNFFLESGSMKLLVMCEAKNINQIRELVLQAVADVQSGILDDRVFQAAKEVHLTVISNEQTDAARILADQAEGLLLNVPVDDHRAYWQEALRITKVDVLRVAERYLRNPSIVIARAINL